MRLVTSMSASKAKEFFMNPKNYFTLDLPNYFTFNDILKLSDKLVTGKDFNGSIVDVKKPREIEDVNYKIIHNKDGKYAWRSFELIHPILYVKLVNDITDKNNWKLIKDRFKEFQNNSQIICCSIPGGIKKNNKKESILRWWEEFEQKSISASLKYSIMACTDITDCYGSIYTHTISWALHGKDTAKQSKADLKLLGNIIDNDISSMHYGQTNGIPQGSEIMNLIAELVLGYVDTLLSKKINEVGITDYMILRYRDDYRIFCNNNKDIEQILNILTNVLSDHNLRLNS